MDKKIWQNKEWLTSEYAKYGTSTIAKNCKIGDSTVCYWLKKHEIKTRSRSESRIMTTSRKNHINRAFFEKIDSSEKAYWLGFIMADGCIREYKKGLHQFCFELAEIDANVIYRFKNDTNFTGDIHHCNNNKKGNFRARMLIADQEFSNNLINLGVATNKTGKEKFSNIETKYDRDFIRGFFDGDGYVMFKNVHGKRVRSKFHIVCMNYEILQTIKDILAKKAGVVWTNKSLHKKYVGACAYELETSTLTSINKIFKFLYYEKCLCLKRKADKFKEFNDYYVNHSKISKNKNFNKTTERYSPNFTEM